MMIKSNNLSTAHTVTQSKGHIVSDMGNEKVMLSVKNGKYYNLGEIGGVIWDSMEQPISVQQLVYSLINEYDVEEVVCEKQVIDFLEGLLAEGLVEVH